MRSLDRLLAAAGCAAATATAAWTPASAFEAMQGCFVAERACPATPAVRGEGNPGGVVLDGGTGYELLGRNRDEGATHFRVRVPSADPRERWVETSCGRATAGTCGGDAERGGEAGDEARGDGGGRREARSHADNLLAVSWQPAFCERQGGRPECAGQAAGRFDATHLVLHGLWPQPRDTEYCGADEGQRRLDQAGDWDRLEPVELSAATRAALEEAMPGTRSSLDRHEWTRHGTCYGGTAEEYFGESLRLLGELNAGPVRELLARSIGRTVTIEQVQGAFDRAFGPGAGRRVAMECEPDGGRRLVAELQVNLAGEVTEGTRLAELIAAARPAPRKCSEGVVDRVGRQ